MINSLIQLIRSGPATQRELFPDLPKYARGLPAVTSAPCKSRDGCRACIDACPTNAITVTEPGQVTLDLGRCIACGECVEACPTGTLVEDRGTRVAVRRRADLIRTNDPSVPPTVPNGESAGNLFHRSLHVREVSTGDNAADLEASASTNPIFDSSRFGIHVVASPRFADALLVTGPVGRAMQEPLRRCYDAMAEPRLVIAAGASATSGGLHARGYAEGNGVDAILPVDVYIPGHPPHPWYLLHALLLAMGHPDTTSRS